MVVGRFIPACAGNRDSCERATSIEAVHPRVCGEQVKTKWLITKETGSSPRVRGTAYPKISHPESLRFIPACAGNSFGATHRDSKYAVHPRVCGEQNL